MHFASLNAQTAMRNNNYSGQSTTVEEAICKSFYYYLIGRMCAFLDASSVANKIYEISNNNSGSVSMFAGLLLELDEEYLKLSIEEPILKKTGTRGYLDNAIVVKQNGEIELQSFRKISGQHKEETDFYETCGYDKEKMNSLINYLQILYIEYLKLKESKQKSSKR